MEQEEKPISINTQEPFKPQADSEQSARLPQPIIPPDSLLGDWGKLKNIGNFLSEHARKAKRIEKIEKSEDDFGKDVERIAILVMIDEEMQSTRFNEASLPPLGFPDPDDLLNAYKNSPPQDRARRKEGVSTFTQTAIRGTLTRLTDDLRVLYLDQGLSIEEASEKINSQAEPITHIENGIQFKKRFGQQNKNEQMNILQDLIEMRRRILRDNAGLYFYHLSSIEEYKDPTSKETIKLKNEFKNANENSQLEIAAKARVDVTKGLNQLMSVNLLRLRGIEKLEPDVIPISSVIQDQFEDASLPQKSTLLENALKHKAELTIPHLDDIYRLRTILEHYLGMQGLKIKLTNQTTDFARLSIEVDRIDQILTDYILTRGNGLEQKPTESEMEEIVRKTSIQYNDSTLADTFKRVLLLRTDAGDIF